MKTTIETGSGVSAVAMRFNEAEWVKQGTWPGAFLWFFPILESFSAEWTGQVLDPELQISDYACVGQPHGAFDCLIGAGCFSAVRARMEKGWLQAGAKYFHDYARICDDKCNEWLTFSQQLARADLATADNAELASMLSDYFALMRQNGAFMDTIIVLADLLGDVVGRSVEELLGASGIDDPAAYGLFLEVHLPAPRSTNIILSQAALRVLAAAVASSESTRQLFLQKTPETVVTELRNADAALYARFAEHKDRFGWLNTYSFSGQPFSIEEIVALVQEMLEEPAAQTAVTESIGEALRKRIEQLSVPEPVRDLLQATSDLTYINTAKDDAHQITWQSIRSLIAATADRLQCAVDDIPWYSPHELVGALENSGAIDRRFVEQRRQGWALLKTEDSMAVVQGSEDMERLRREIKPAVPVDAKVLHGRPIVAGRVRGRARIVLTSSDGVGVETGDILIATNTNPDFIPAMRRAAAFVTDTGNLICHAVIAAREFQKPCVIATQIGTQVLQDGEWIEVDGASGIVTRLDMGDPK